MIEPNALLPRPFVFKIKDADSPTGEIAYQLVVMAKNDEEAMKKIRNHMAVIIQDINETLGDGNKTNQKIK